MDSNNAMNLKDYIVSIDLGCSKVVATLGTLGIDQQLVIADIVSKPMSGFVRGEISNIESVTTALRSAVSELESRNNIIVNEAFVSVEGKHIVCADNSGFVYVGSDGEIVEENVKQLHANMNNVQAPEGKIILSRILQNYKINSREVTTTPIGMYGKQLEATFSFILAGKSVLERISKAFDRAGIKQQYYLAAAEATASVVATDDEKEMGVAVINLGAGVTNIAIYHDKVLRYVASIPMGQEIINRDIKATAIPEKSIEGLKTSFGYATASAIPYEKLNYSIKIKGRTPHEKCKEIPYRDLCTIINARLLDIVEFVIDEIRNSGYHNKLGAGIILTGGGAKMSGIDTLFKERTGHEVRIGYAEVGLSSESIDGISAPEFATSIGLLAMGLERTNLVPSQHTPVEKKNNSTQDNSDKKEREESGDTSTNEQEQEGGTKGGKKPKKGWFKGFIQRIDEAVFGQVVGDEDI